MKSSHTPEPKLIAEFEVPGEPVSKSRARFTKRGSKTVAYTPQKTRDGEIRVALAFRQSSTHLGINPTDCEIAYRVESEFYSGSRQRRDVDNMTKLVLDGLNGVAWVDDDQVLEIESRKEYVPKTEARTTVRVFEIGRTAPPHGNCIRCGKEFRTYESWASNPKGKKYCSRECVYAHRIERRKRTCANCRKTFLAWGETHETKFCSVKCKSAASRTVVECTNCGKSFTKQTCHVRKSNLCSDDCMRALDAKRQRERRSTRFPGTCDTCGAGTTRKEYHQCDKCRRAGYTPGGRPSERAS